MSGPVLFGPHQLRRVPAFPFAVRRFADSPPNTSTSGARSTIEINPDGQVTDAENGVEETTSETRPSSSNFVPGRLAIVYTCEICNLRASKTFSKHAYTKGIVIIRCDGCDKLHLIADNLGWFDHLGKNIEEISAQMGRTVQKLSSHDAQQLIDLAPHLKALLGPLSTLPSPADASIAATTAPAEPASTSIRPRES